MGDPAGVRRLGRARRGGVDRLDLGQRPARPARPGPRCRRRRPPSSTPSASVVGTGVSSGGGRRSVTEMAGHGTAWSSGWPCTSSAIAPEVQPPLPEIGGPQNRAGHEEVRHRLILSYRSSASRRSSAWSTIGSTGSCGVVGRRAARGPTSGCSRRAGSNFLPWRDRVEDAEVRRRVGAAARRPLPAVLVGGEVAVDQPLHEVAGAVLPLDVQVLDQEARHDHPHPVVHPPGRAELAHARRRRSGSRCGPPATPSSCVARLVVRHPLELRAQVVARGLGLVEQHVGVELPPGELLAVRRRALAGAGRAGRRASCAGGSRPTSGAPTCARWRRGRAGRGRGRSPSSLLARSTPASAAARPPRRPSGRLEPVGERLVGQRRRSRRRSQVTGPRSAGRLAPAVLGPGLENGVKTWYGVPSSLVTRPGATAYGDPVRTSSMSCSASAARPARRARGRTVRSPRRRAPGRRRPRARPGRPRSTGSPRRTVSPLRAVAARAATRDQVAPPGGPPGPHSAGSSDEERERPSSARRPAVEQRRVVREAQVAPEPHHGWHRVPLMPRLPTTSSAASAADADGTAALDTMGDNAA